MHPPESVHLIFDATVKTYNCNTDDSVLESAFLQPKRVVRKENIGNAIVVPVHRPPPVLDSGLKPVPSTKHTTKVNSQGKTRKIFSLPQTVLQRMVLLWKVS